MNRSEVMLMPNLWNKWFGSWRTVEIEKDGLSVVTRHSTKKFLFAELDAFPSISVGFFSVSIELELDSSESFLITGMSKRHINTELRLLEENCLPFFIEKLLMYVQDINEKIYKRFLRDSWVRQLDKKVDWVLRNYTDKKDMFSNAIDASTQSFIDGLMLIHPVIEHKEEIRTQFESYKLRENVVFFSEVEKNELTEMQSLAVVRDNDYNLILAAAGTGKTSVMVAKAIYLVRSDLAAPDEVLLLAYNNNAAKELDQRIKERATKFIGSVGDKSLSGDYKAIKSTTFHALGLKVLKECQKNSFVSVLATDTQKREKFIQMHLEKFIVSNPDVLGSFISLQYVATNPFDFESKAEYERHLRDNNYRNLNGDLVKGYQEVLISNYLYQNNINFIYEPRYMTSDGTVPRFEEGVNYKPDFLLNDHGIYIEHFGIDRKGNVRKGIDREKYNYEIKLKRQTHKKYKTPLIETFHFEYTEGDLISGLEAKLVAHGVKLTPLPNHVLFKKIKELGMVSEFSKIMRQSIDAVKAEQLDKNQIIKRLETIKHFDIKNFVIFLTYLQNQYSSELLSKGEIDFDDMINEATELVETGQFEVNWKFILVDEFQDISTARFNFVKALINRSRDSSLSVVGDDWQSIYRFNGGKLELITRFSEFLGEHSLTRLKTSFRYNDSIADVAGTFIMKNPEQHQKDINTLVPVSSPQVYLLTDNLDPQRIIDVIRSKDPDGNIAVLARYNFLLNEVREKLSTNLGNHNVKYWTFHRSKGLEVDYCILLGFKQGGSGFPTENKSDEAVEALLPSLDGFLYSEERRLMYVALTRAKKKTYLLADPLAPSVFIDELIFQDYDVLINSVLFKEKYRSIFKCMKCTDGYLIRKPSKFKSDFFYSCNTYPGCHVIIQECPRCQAPMEDNNLRRKCKNPDCQKEIPVCPKCYRPLKLRSGRFGQFWGCSGYAAKPPNQCKFSRNLRPDELPDVEDNRVIRSILDYGRKVFDRLH
jgi:DNA helicase IV